MALFDDMLAIENARVQGGSNESLDTGYTAPEPEPVSTTAKKKLSVEGKYEQKKQAIEPRVLKYQVDGDTPNYYGQTSGDRNLGFDAYETAKTPEFYQDPKSGYARRNTKERQRERYAKQFGVPAEQVTDKMMYKQGFRDNLQSIVNKTRAPGDAPYVPPTDAEISDEWITATADNPNPSQIGSKENPLDIVLGRRATGKADQYGRQITEEFNMNTGQNVNNMMTDQYNAIQFKDDKFDKAGTEDKRAKLAGWNGTPPSQMENDAEIDRYEAWRDDEQGYFSKLFGTMKSAGIKTFADLNEGINYAEDRFLPDGAAKDAVKDIGGGYGDLISKQLNKAKDQVKNNGNFIDDSNLWKDGKNPLVDEGPEAQAWRDQVAGLSQEGRNSKDRTYKLGEEQWEKGGVANNVKAIINFGKAVPQTFAESIPEMAAMMLPAGSEMLTLSRLKKQEDTFEAKNKRKFNKGELALATAWNEFNLRAEKLGIEKGVKEFIKLFGKDKAKSLLGKTWKGALGATGAGAFEFLQELSEGTADAYFDQKAGDRSALEISQDPKQTAGAMLGALTGGGMATTGVAVGAAKDAVAATPGAIMDLNQWNKDRKSQNQLEADVANMSDEDYSVSVTEAGKAIEAIDDQASAIDSEVDRINKAEDVDDLIDNGSEEVSDYVDMETNEIIESGKVFETEEYNNRVEQSVNDVVEAADNLGQPRFKKSMTDKLGLPETATAKEIKDEIKKQGKKGAIAIGMTENDIKNMALDEFDANIDKYKKNLSGELKKAKQKLKDVKGENAKNIKRFVKAREKAKSRGISGSRSDEKVETTEDTTSTESPSVGKAVGDAFKTLVPGLSTDTSNAKENTYKQLTKYSDKALEEAANDPETSKQTKKLAQKIINERANTSKRKGLNQEFAGDEQKTAYGTFSPSKANKSQNFNRIKTLVSQKNIESQEEVDYIRKAIEAMQKQGVLTRGQAKVLNNRLNTVGKNAKPGVASPLTGDVKFRTQAQIQNDINNLQAEADLIQNQSDNTDNIDTKKQNGEKIRKLVGDMRVLTSELKDAAELEAQNQQQPTQTEDTESTGTGSETADQRRERILKKKAERDKKQAEAKQKRKDELKKKVEEAKRKKNEQDANEEIKAEAEVKTEELQDTIDTQKKIVEEEIVPIEMNPDKSVNGYTEMEEAANDGLHEDYVEGRTLTEEEANNRFCGDG